MATYEMAKRVAQAIVTELAPDCERIAVAGSVRRGKGNPKDIEIVYIPRVSERQIGFFPDMVEEVDEFDLALDRLLARGVLLRDDRVKRWGEKYKRAIHVGSGMVIELFAAREDTWGYIYALRTGPADWNRKLVTRRDQGGMLPKPLMLVAGNVLRYGQFTPVPDEATFFGLFGMPCWPPEERSVGRLASWEMRKLAREWALQPQMMYGAMRVRRGN